MHGFVAMVVRGGALDPAAALERARRALVAGAEDQPGADAPGLVRAPFALWPAPPDATEGGGRDDGADGGRARGGASGATDDTAPGGGALASVWGFAADPADDVRFLAACAAAMAIPGAGLPAPPERPLGRRALLRWDPAARTLLLVTEPNGLRPVYVHDGPEALVVASEAKAIPAALGRNAVPDADALCDLWTLGHCAGLRTLFAGVSLAPPGAALAWSADRRETRAWPAPAFSEARGGDARAAAEALAGALETTLRAYRARAPRAVLALSGGMDSRAVLAVARGLWPDLEGVTFGDAASPDVALAVEIAARAGLPLARVAPEPDAFARWAPWVVWRGDGMLSAIHGHGMDALIARAAGRAALNGIGGDFLLGAFLRPDHLRGAADPARATAFVRASRRFHGEALEDVFQPAVLRARTAPTDAVLAELFAPLAGRRFGNALTLYWLRHYAPRITALGLGLEDPWATQLGPLADPWFVRAAAGVPLELRFMSRAYRRMLTELAPRLAAVRWERTGVRADRPWPLHAAARWARRCGLLARPRPAVDHAAAFRGPLAAWLRETLLGPRARGGGLLQPAYVERALGDHLAGRANRAAELSLAVTVELWRRAFAEGEGPPPPPLPGRATC
uniref:asparagine synthase (glutamine-hydrolyzing) n=1 Tax=Eiseniibacteriota bacterium TaxID=2212470 RepID=A0A832MIX7_UNCEI